MIFTASSRPVVRSPVVLRAARATRQFRMKPRANLEQRSNPLRNAVTGGGLLVAGEDMGSDE